MNIYEKILILEAILTKEKYDKNTIKKIILLLKNYTNLEGINWINSPYGNIKYGKISNKNSYNINIFEKEKITISFKNKINKQLLMFLKVYFKNISNIIKQKKALESIAKTDMLTGALNNTSLIEYLKENKYKKNIGVAFIDANGLSIINNSQGHKYGDQLLCFITESMKKIFKTKHIYRKGGDEFILIVEDISKTSFIRKMEMLEKILSTSKYTASIGYIYSDKNIEITELINKADELMYEKKEIFRTNNPSKYEIKKVLQKNIK